MYLSFAVKKDSTVDDCPTTVSEFPGIDAAAVVVSMGESNGDEGEGCTNMSCMVITGGVVGRSSLQITYCLIHIFTRKCIIYKTLAATSSLKNKSAKISAMHLSYGLVSRNKLGGSRFRFGAILDSNEK